MTVQSVLVAFAVVVLAGTGCMSASRHAEDVQQGLEGDKLTVGTVQREIRQGMSGAEVVEVLGSPNIVSTDEKGREVWVYDRISTDSVHSSSSGGILALVFGAQGGGGGGGLGQAGYETGARSTIQLTLTVIIKFDEAGKVRDFDYLATRF